MRTILYVDGFNLYFRALKAHPEYRWLNLKLLAEEILNPENDLCAVKYYTARVSARTDPGGPRRQQIYLDALFTIPGIEIVQGNFLVTKTYASMVPHAPTNGKPVFKEWPAKVRIVKTEEKGSDVNLGSHLIRDAFTDQFDVAVVITNDTDLIEPIRIVVQEVGKPVGIISPVDNAATGLKNVASFLRYIRHGHLTRSQFPDVIVREGKDDLIRPNTWAKDLG